MNICIFDTETISVNKPFCYNVGYKICDDNFNTLCERDYVVEQIWRNLPLFATAYYAEKKPIYVARMRRHEVIMDKWGYIMRQMSRDFQKYNVQYAFAYNSMFDDRVFDFNNEWFHCNNPFDTVPILDIRGYAHKFITDNNYCNFCDTYGLYTDSGNYSSTAEDVYRYLKNDMTFNEEHTALNDSRIETEILQEAVKRGAVLGTDYPTLASIQRTVLRTLTVHDKPTDTTHTYTFHKLYITKDKTKIELS